MIYRISEYWGGGFVLSDEGGLIGIFGSVDHAKLLAYALNRANLTRDWPQTAFMSDGSDLVWEAPGELEIPKAI